MIYCPNILIFDMGIIIPLILIFFTCLFIWRACDGFEIASEYLGRNLSEGVRGGTFNAISSSIPELLTTLIALFILSDKDGFAIGIGTTAGSALFNGMIIPAVCIFTVVGTVVLGKKVTSVNVSSKVILRDGLSLILAEAVLILILGGRSLSWWQGLVLMIVYFIYFGYMLGSMKSVEADDKEDEEEEEEDDEPMGAMGKVFYCLSLGPLLNLEGFFVTEKAKEKIKSETWNGWPLLIAATSVIAGSCYLLVKACEWLGTGNVENPSYSLFGHDFVGLGMPPLFVAVIFASMATSVPDTVMSVRDARDGDYDDAVANALGSNIFDICFALGFPLFLFTLMNGSIELSKETAAQSAELRLSLLILTIVGFFVYFIGKRQIENGVKTITMGKGKAVILLVIYVSYVIYVVARGADAVWAGQISDWLQAIITKIPSITSPPKT